MSAPAERKIWVDADACPVAIREILFRAARRTGVQLILVANRHLPVPRAPNIAMRQVRSGFDVADHEIVDNIHPGDIVITADIPLAAEAIGCGAHALSPRGERFLADTIRARLNVRDFMETMRASGVHSGGPPALGARERKQFADQLDRLLAQAP